MLLDPPRASPISPVSASGAITATIRTGAIVKSLAQILQTDLPCVMHTSSVAQCAAGHRKKDIFQIRLDDLDAFRDHASAQEGRQERGQPIRSAIGGDAEVII